MAEKNDCNKTLQVLITNEKLVQLRYCSISPDFLYVLFDDFTFKIFDLKTQLFDKIKCVL